MIWKGGFFLESKGVKILVRANLKESKMELIIRGTDMELAQSIVQDIYQEITAVSGNYPGVASDYEETQEMPSLSPGRTSQEKDSKRWKERLVIFYSTAER